MKSEDIEKTLEGPFIRGHLNIYVGSQERKKLLKLLLRACNKKSISACIFEAIKYYLTKKQAEEEDLTSHN